jgi:hypothetical protein
MPQIILGILIIIIGVWVVAAVVWIVQWIAACGVWVWQVILMPFFIYLTPAVVILIIAAAIFWGSWIAIQNYFLSLKTNINPAGLLEKFTRYYIISTLTMFLATIYLSLILSSLMLIYQPGELFVVHVIEYYESITFPAFRIHFPFWGD